LVAQSDQRPVGVRMDGVNTGSDGRGDALHPFTIQDDPNRQVSQFKLHSIGFKAENGDDFCWLDFQGFLSDESEKTLVLVAK